MKRKVDYEKAWKKFRRWMSEDGYFYFGRKGTVRIRIKMTKILKQCTKREDKVVKEGKKKQKSVTKTSFSIHKMVTGINSVLKEQGIEGELKEAKREDK